MNQPNVMDSRLLSYVLVTDMKSIIITKDLIKWADILTSLVHKHVTFAIKKNLHAMNHHNYNIVPFYIITDCKLAWSDDDNDIDDPCEDSFIVRVHNQVIFQVVTYDDLQEYINNLVLIIGDKINTIYGKNKNKTYCDARINMICQHVNNDN